MANMKEKWKERRQDKVVIIVDVEDKKEEEEGGEVISILEQVTGRSI